MVSRPESERNCPTVSARPLHRLGPSSRRRGVVLGVVVAALVVGASACGSVRVDSAHAPMSTASPPVRRHPPTPVGTTSTLPPALGAGPATVYVLSDSVILGAEPQLRASLPGWQVTFDSKVSRNIYTGLSILRHRSGPAPRVVIIHLCTNWSQITYGHEIDEAMADLPGVDRVIWVTCTPWNPGVISADAAIGVASVHYRQVVVADWAAISADPGYTYDDHLHLRPAGAAAMARLIAPLVGPAPVS